SEAIGIAATVLIVDRLIAWRESRQWRKVRHLILESAESPSAQILSLWQQWLIAVSRAPAIQPSMVQGNQAPASDEQRKQRMDSLTGYLGDPVGSKLADLPGAIGVRDFAPLTDALAAYLYDRPLSSGDPAWTHLTAGLAAPAGRLSHLIDAY